MVISDKLRRNMRKKCVFETLKPNYILRARPISLMLKHNFLFLKIVILGSSFEMDPISLLDLIIPFLRYWPTTKFPPGRTST